MVLILAGGLLAGALHVLSGADHLAAIVPLAASRPRGAWTAGLRWGAGHAGGVLLAFGLVLLLRDLLDIGTLSAWSEQAVGLTLIAIGFWGLRAALGHSIHTHIHEHDGVRHAHIHGHAPGSLHPASAFQGPEDHAHGHAALAVGLLHGMAGTSHFLGVLPALAFPSRTAALAYIGAFGAGTVLAMTLFAASVGFAAGRASAGTGTAWRRLMLGCCSFTIAVGTVWLFL